MDTMNETEQFAEIMNQAIEDASRSEGERDEALARVRELEISDRLRKNRMDQMRVFYPLAHTVINLYYEEYYWTSYDALVDHGIDVFPEEQVLVPESETPISLSNPLCRAELKRVLYDLGYKSEYKIEQGNDDFTITGRGGDGVCCIECDATWVLEMDRETEHHEPGCENHQPVPINCIVEMF